MIKKRTVVCPILGNCGIVARSLFIGAFMIQSMTAFARVQKQIEVGVLCWEIRSVNHRYLDSSFRLPESFRFIEPHLRTVLRDKISRGKLECQLKYQDTGSDNQSLFANKGLVNALVDLSNQLSASHHLANDFGVGRLLAWPGVVQMSSPDVEELGVQAIALFEEAIGQLQQVRDTEGKALQAHVLGRLQQLENEVERARSIVVHQANHVKDKLLSRLYALQIELPEGRLEQEIALILTRLDISEELDRLQTHINEVNRTLNCDKIAGRRLDFLMQELNREANTLSSKSDSVELTQSAVEMKVLIEQMREQIQNIE